MSDQESSSWTWHALKLIDYLNGHQPLIKDTLFQAILDKIPMVLLTRLRVLVPKRSLIAAVRLLKLVCGLPGTLLENAIVGVYVDGASIQWTSVSYYCYIISPSADSDETVKEIDGQ